MSEYISASAYISRDGKYRYRLTREWRGTHDPKNWEWLQADIGVPKSCVFVMLNPSTADGETDDPTIRRCVSFAKRHKFERMDVVNLFAYRATKRKELLALNHNDDPVGVGNQRHVESVIENAGLIICAWGADGGHLGQDETMQGWLMGKKLHALGLTKDGKPKHPLYLKGNSPLIPFGDNA